MTLHYINMVSSHIEKLSKKYAVSSWFIIDLLETPIGDLEREQLSENLPYIKRLLKC